MQGTHPGFLTSEAASGPWEESGLGFKLLGSKSGSFASSLYDPGQVSCSSERQFPHL